VRLGFQTVPRLPYPSDYTETVSARGNSRDQLHKLEMRDLEICLEGKQRRRFGFEHDPYCIEKFVGPTTPRHISKNFMPLSCKMSLSSMYLTSRHFDCATFADYPKSSQAPTLQPSCLPSRLCHSLQPQASCTPSIGHRASL
jgi:hypothetical protein